LLKAIAGALDISERAALELVSRHGFERSTVSRAFKMDADGDVSSTLREIVKPLFLELISEIKRVLVFTAAETHGVPVSQVCLLGSVAQWRGSQELLLSLLDFEAPDDRAEFTQVFEDEYDDTQMPWAGLFSDISIAMGLALRGMVEYE
jgi:Tfp pilus assembly PilM family ATPase